jgi:prepilin-type processing-associated H-X9-DG protein
VSVDLSAAGTMMSSGTMSGGSVPAGTPVDVWLLHYDPPGPNGTQSNARITFAGKILGVIVLTQKLRQTDPALGAPGTSYDQNAGARGMEPGAEILTISQDMRTLTTDRLVVTGCMEEARIITEPGGVGMSSYGANGRLHRFTGDSHRILLVEYNKIVADVVGAGASDVWTEQIAPRHGGTLNVLFGDGRVEARTPRSIDPRVRPIHDEYWCPTRDLVP